MSSEYAFLLRGVIKDRLSFLRTQTVRSKWTETLYGHIARNGNKERHGCTLCVYRIDLQVLKSRTFPIDSGAGLVEIPSTMFEKAVCIIKPV